MIVHEKNVAVHGVFRYRVEAGNQRLGSYVASLLQGYGLMYGWEVVTTTRLPRRTVRIVTERTTCVCKRDSHGDLGRSVIVLSADAGYARSLGVSVRPLQASSDADGWQLLIAPNDSRAVACQTIPIPVSSCVGFEADDSWRHICHLTHPRGGLVPVGLRRNDRGTDVVLLGLDISGLMLMVTLGIQASATPATEVSDWSEVYGKLFVPEVCAVPFVDSLWEMICRLIVDMNQEALPMRVGYYPPGKTAPVVVTGDSDDATPSQLASYLTALDVHGIKGSVMLMDVEMYGKRALRAYAAEDHCFGIHPYASDGDGGDFATNYRRLSRQYLRTFGNPIYGVRNHRFHCEGAEQRRVLAMEAGPLFDMNSVAGDGRRWVGPPTGIGIPIPFPPAPGGWSPYPLHFPTAVEDDVFLFEHDYCYRPFIDGDLPPASAAMGFLSQWVCRLGRPALLNLHPEHVDGRLSGLFLQCLEWLTRAQIWTPSLKRLAEWTSQRSQVKLRVTDQGNMVTVSGDEEVLVCLTGIRLGECCAYPGEHTLVRRPDGQPSMQPVLRRRRRGSGACK